MWNSQCCPDALKEISPTTDKMEREKDKISIRNSFWYSHSPASSLPPPIFNIPRPRCQALLNCPLFIIHLPVLIPTSSISHTETRLLLLYWPRAGQGSHYFKGMRGSPGGCVSSSTFSKHCIEVTCADHPHRSVVTKLYWVCTLMSKKFERTLHIYVIHATQKNMCC